MSRYIDADALKEWLDEYLSVFKKYDKGTIKGFVDHAPSIDIVRCKDCEYIRIYEDETNFYYCALECRPNRQWSVDETDYCSWGERKSDE